MTASSMAVVREVLGADVVEEVDEPIIDYIANVLADEDFDFGFPDGHGIFQALGELLIDAGCVSDQDHCLKVLPFPLPFYPPPNLNIQFAIPLLKNPKSFIDSDPRPDDLIFVLT
jgi:hypothetical protein